MEKSKPAKARPKVDTSHYFIDGCSSRKGLLGIVAFPNRLRGTDTEFTTFYCSLDGDWSHETFDFDGRSVVYAGQPGAGEWWVLGKRGEVARVGDDINYEQVPDAGTGPDANGYVNRIALIEDRLYVCGFRRQVCVRDASGWKRMDHGLLEPRSARGSSLEAIDGVAQDCLYAVGNKGQIWHFDGSRWRQCACPTNVDLHEVRCVSRDQVLVVGQKGTVLLGSGDNWKVITDDEFDEDLWGVESFGGEIYVAGYGGIGKIHANGIAPVDTALKRVVLGYRLRAKEGVLWSIGNDDIVAFDGKRWREVLCPDNTP
jgi:hypothetical protein